VGRKIRDRQAKAELSTKPVQSYADRVSRRYHDLAKVMRIISSLFAIVLCVGGCDCMPLVPVKPTVLILGRDRGR